MSIVFCPRSGEMSRSRTLSLSGIALWLFDELVGMGMFVADHPLRLRVRLPFISLDLCFGNLMSGLI